jgi:hypothetical protein
MKLKTLFLGSAAVLAVSGVAQAADFKKAEPIAYVKICDAFGTGYWYIPGTDTCIRIQGHVLVDVNIHGVEQVDTATSNGHSAAWDITSEGQLAFTIKTMTEHGDLTGYVRVTGVSDNSDDASLNAEVDRMWFQLGKFKAGYDNSIYNTKSLFTGTSYNANDTVDEFSLNWTMGGYGFSVAVGDPRDRWGSKLPTTYSVPEITAAMTARGSWGDLKVAAGVIQSKVGWVWGVQGGVTLKADAISKGDQFVINGGIGTGSCFVYDGGSCYAVDGSLSWAALAGFKHVINSMWQVNIGGSYLGAAGKADLWSASANVVWEPVDDFTVDIRGVYAKTVGGADAWTGRVRMQYQW